MLEKRKFIKVHPRFRNRYFIALYVFAFWLMFFDNMSFWDLMGYKSDVKKLEKEKAIYEDKILHAKTNLNDLTTNMDNLEKFAREQYFMKKDNEDIFVIVDQK
ncbi:MAG: cell division protein DivIC [Flavobacteriales bacterium]|jgi:cell division protein DivIC